VVATGTRRRVAPLDLWPGFRHDLTGAQLEGVASLATLGLIAASRLAQESK
jgi:hypothetical protein